MPFTELFLSFTPLLSVILRNFYSLSFFAIRRFLALNIKAVFSFFILTSFWRYYPVENHTACLLMWVLLLTKRMIRGKWLKYFDYSVSFTLQFEDNGGASQVALMVKNLPAKVGDIMRGGFDPWVGKIPWRRRWQRTAVGSCLEHPMDRGAWWATAWGDMASCSSSIRYITR